MLYGLWLTTDANSAQRNLVVKSTDSGVPKRVALVIGNATYKDAPPLRNSVNDARSMSSALNGLGFEVIEVTDAPQKEINRAITLFGSKLNSNTIALFYYAGHGIQVKGKNYIIPVDAQIATEAAVASESVAVETVLEQLNASPVSIIILDACRNNPFERGFRKMGGGGLAQMDAPRGSFIAYATAPGKTAADGNGKNGLFTQELLRQINEPGLDLEKVFKRVRANVAAKSGDAQVPWDSSSMTGDFYFKPGMALQTTSLIPSLVVPPAEPTALAPSPQAENGPSLEVTMQFVLDKVNSLAGSEIAYKIRNPIKISEGTATAKLPTTPVSSPLRCKIVNFPTSPSIDLGTVINAIVMTYAQYAAQELVRNGDFDSVITQMHPSYFVVQITTKRRDKPIYLGTKTVQVGKGEPVSTPLYDYEQSMVFFLEDQNTADRVAKALNHAVELCGGDRDNSPF